MRWFTRRVHARGLPEFSGVFHHIVIPADREGRPGYALRAVGRSAGIREPSVGGTTSDFFLKYAPHSHLLGSCTGKASVSDNPQSRANALVEFALNSPPGRRFRCLARPTPVKLAMEAAYLCTVEQMSGPGAGLVVTDRFFDHAGWSFTVGTIHHPQDAPEKLATAQAILDSWEWLPEAQ